MNNTPENNLIVTLDGPAGVGKTTIAKKTAEVLGIAYLDTGAMFRGIARKLGPGAHELPEPELAERLAGFVFDLSGVGENTLLTLNSNQLGPEIRTEEVGMMASNLAKIPVVRTFLRQAQQGLGRNRSLTAEGRDMGSVVFPGAKCKFFLDAAPEERAARRCRQLEQMGQKPDLAKLTEQIRIRDDQDRNRAESPLKPAGDARIIDTTDLSENQVFELVIGAVKSAPA